MEDCHAFRDLVILDYNNNKNKMSSSTMSMPSVAHSSLTSGVRSDMSVGSIGSALSMGSCFSNKNGGYCTPQGGGSVAGGGFVGGMES